MNERSRVKLRNINLFPAQTVQYACTVRAVASYVSLFVVDYVRTYVVILITQWGIPELMTFVTYMIYDTMADLVKH